MKYWFVNHNSNSYKVNNRLFGRDSKVLKKLDMVLTKIHKGDKIVYYANDTQQIMGIFLVSSEPLTEDPKGKWKEGYYFAMRPIYTPSPAPSFPVLIHDKNVKFDKLDRKKWGSQIRGRPAVEISKDDFRKIKCFLLGLVREPTNEQGVRHLFSKHHERMGYPIIVEMGDPFPDATVIDRDGIERKIEFEWMSRNFLTHEHKGKCDAIVCWRNDWPRANPPFKIIDFETFLDKVH